MADRRIRYSGIAAVVTGPLVASFAAYLAAQPYQNPVGASTILVLSLVLAWPITLLLGPFVHGVLRKQNRTRWFHYATASAIVAAGVVCIISLLIGEWSAVILLWFVGLGIVTAVLSWWILRSDRQNVEQHRRLWLGAIGAGVFVGAGVIFFNLTHLAFASAVLLSERRPALLSDARWNQPASARNFAARFHAGTNERELLVWLEANRFVVDRSIGRAKRLLSGLPCAEFVDVTWKASGYIIRSAEAHVSEAGCL